MHCHLELFEDMLGIAARCAQRGIRILAVTASPRSWRKFTDRIQMFDNVKVGLGLHPQLGNHLIDDLPLFETLLPKCKYIGEIGLDAGRDFAPTLATQTKVFRRVLNLCSQNPGKVLSIHSVRSSGQVLSLLERDFDFSSGKAVLHWFTGSPEQARRAVDSRGGGLRCGAMIP
jgi:TatD DNase family protein